MQSDIMATETSSMGARLRLGATSAVGSLFLWHLVAKINKYFIIGEMDLTVSLVHTSVRPSIYCW